MSHRSSDNVRLSSRFRSRKIIWDFVWNRPFYRNKYFTFQFSKDFASKSNSSLRGYISLVLGVVVNLIQGRLNSTDEKEP